MIELADDAFRSARQFARYMLQGNRLPLAPVRTAIISGAEGVLTGVGMAAVLFRSGCWQVELLVGMPGVVAPPHKHPNVHSADVVLCGSVCGHTGIRPFGKERGPLLANLQTIPAGFVHAGQSGESGVVYLSFQQWLNGVQPSHIILDWEAA
jgi:hypothetical protein